MGIELIDIRITWRLRGGDGIRRLRSLDARFKPVLITVEGLAGEKGVIFGKHSGF
jgi:hypothetical protein